MNKELQEELIQAAFKARDLRYSPYSNFQVGAALLTKSGKIFTGTNVENASYGGGICAERSAAVKAISEGEREFTAVVITGYPLNATDEEKGFAYPCGICRQFLNEFSTDDMDVIVARTPEDFRIHPLSELLPHSFGPEDL